MLPALILELWSFLKDSSAKDQMLASKEIKSMDPGLRRIDGK
jgi:hypothetical protein